MAKINEIDITSLQFQEGAAPATPATTKWRAYFKTDGLYVIDDAGAETGPLSTGGGVGSWATWSPTLLAATTNPTIGNGTVEASSIQIGTGTGSLVICRYYFEFGSTSAAGSGTWQINGPVTAKTYDAGSGAFGVVQIYDASAARFWHGSVRYVGTPEYDFQVGDSTAGQSVASAYPITWATGDRFSAHWSYEVA